MADLREVEWRVLRLDTGAEVSRHGDRFHADFSATLCSMPVVIQARDITVTDWRDVTTTSPGGS